MRIINSLKYIFKPRYWHYWIIKPSTLKIGYNDADTLILHANMSILQDFYNMQIGPQGHVDWSADKKHQKVFAEVKEILTWWKKYLIYQKYLYTGMPADIEQPKNIFEMDKVLYEEFNNGDIVTIVACIQIGRQDMYIMT